MGTDDLFKKQRKQRKERRHAFKQPRANSFLIVTEGEKTEPFYFEGLKHRIQERIGGMIKVVPAPDIQIHGAGAGTARLLETADELVKKAKIPYQNIWLVFDKDDFEDFDETIKSAEERGYHVAWSNPCFEYWLYLHFAYSDSALCREDWFQKLKESFVAYDLSESGYQKNEENLYELLESVYGVETAIKNAKRRMADFKTGESPSKCDPGTKVHVLVHELRSYLEE